VTDVEASGHGKTKLTNNMNRTIPKKTNTSKHKVPQWVRNVKDNVEKAPEDRKTPQFAKIHAGFLWYGQNLSLQAHHVYTHLRMFAWKTDDPRPVFPSLDLLETVTKLSRALVIEALEELEMFGWLEIDRGRKTFSKYGREKISDVNTYTFKVPSQRINGTSKLEPRYSPVSKEERVQFKRAQSNKRRGGKNDLNEFLSRKANQFNVPDDGQDYHVVQPSEPELWGDEFPEQTYEKGEDNEPADDFDGDDLDSEEIPF